MALSLTDLQIMELLEEPKSLPANWETIMRLKPKRGHHEREIDVAGEAGNDFRLILRRSKINILDFSVILAVLDPNSNQVFRLRRHNGRSHEHTNHIEGERFYNFHIHMATARYQRPGSREDGYAEPTDRYTDFEGALDALIQDATFLGLSGQQPRLL